jgi:hypothetical protein
MFISPHVMAARHLNSTLHKHAGVCRHYQEFFIICTTAIHMEKARYLGMKRKEGSGGK